jgi:hypothetical protein
MLYDEYQDWTDIRKDKEDSIHYESFKRFMSEQFEGLERGEMFIKLAYEICLIQKMLKKGDKDAS